MRDSRHYTESPYVRLSHVWGDGIRGQKPEGKGQNFADVLRSFTGKTASAYRKAPR